MEKDNILSCKFLGYLIAEGYTSPNTQIVLRNGDSVETYIFKIRTPYHFFITVPGTSVYARHLTSDTVMEEIMRRCENRVPDRVDTIRDFVEMNPSYRSVLSPFMRDSKIDKLLDE